MSDDVRNVVDQITGITGGRHGVRAVRIAADCQRYAPHAFVGSKDEELVFHDRPAGRAAELMQELAATTASDRIEPISRVDCAVARKVICRTVEFIGSGLQSDLYNRSRLPTVFRRGMLLRAEFLNCVDGQKARRRAADTFFIHYDVP